MRRWIFVTHLLVCFATMTSSAMKSQKFVQMTYSTGANVCSTDPPSQVLPMLPGGETRCGIECLRSSVCPYYQFKSSTPMQCEIYYQFPVNFKIIETCIGFRPRLPSDIIECSINNGDCGSSMCSNTLGSFTCTIACVQSAVLNLNGTSGTITSMNFPSSYVNYAQCQWIIAASAPYTVVRLSFTAFCTEPCCDYVRVYDGNSTSYTLLMSSSGCGAIPGPVTTTQRYMYVTFTTDGSVVNSGFSATYNMQ